MAMMFLQQASAWASIPSGTVPSGKTPTSPEKNPVQHFHFNIFNILCFKIQHFIFTVSTF